MALPELGELTWRSQLACHRLLLGLTKAEFAKLCGASRMTLWKIEAGHAEPTPAQTASIENAVWAELARRSAASTAAGDKGSDASTG